MALGVAKFGCVSSGPFCRAMVSAAFAIENERLFKDLKKFTAVIEDWNSRPRSTHDKPLYLSSLVDDLQNSIVHVGPFSAQFLAKVLIRAGIIDHPELARQAVIHSKSPIYKEVVVLSGVKNPKRNKKGVQTPQAICVARFLKSAASALQVSPAVAENLLCELFRKESKWDFTFCGQPIISVDEAPGTSVTYCYCPDGSKQAVNTLSSLVPSLFPETGITHPTARHQNERWWIVDFDSVNPPSASRKVTFSLFTAAESRNRILQKKYPEPRFLQSTTSNRKDFIAAYSQGDKPRMIATFEAAHVVIALKNRKNMLDHPYTPLAKVARESCGNWDDIWKRRFTEVADGQSITDYRLLTSNELKVKRMTTNSQLPQFALSTDYPAHLQVCFWSTKPTCFIYPVNKLTSFCHLFLLLARIQSFTSNKRHRRHPPPPTIMRVIQVDPALLHTATNQCWSSHRKPIQPCLSKGRSFSR